MVKAEIKAIKAGRLIDGTGRAPVENATVIIENAKIKTVGQNIKIPKEAQVIDATGKTVMPGMIDAHMHLNGPRLEESYVEGLNRPGELKLLDAITDAMDYLSAGFTTRRDERGIYQAGDSGGYPNRASPHIVNQLYAD